MAQYAIIGNWGFGPGEKGISVYRYDPFTGAFERKKNYLGHVSVGNQFPDRERNILYLTDERGSRRGQTGGGGYVLAMRVLSGGKLELLDEKESLSPNPSYFCLDRSKRYALVSHHAEMGHVTHLFQRPDGSYASETLTDDAALTLFALREDGGFDRVCDAYIPKGEGFGNHMIPHLHSVVADPSGELFLVCDKGCDKIYSFRLDRQNGRLVFLSEIRETEGCNPRYGVFHPFKPFFFENNEQLAEAYSYRYDPQSGCLTRLCAAKLLNCAAPKAEPSDIVLSADGGILYLSLRGIDQIAVLRVEENGSLTLLQNISCGGNNPRGLCLSPDGKRLFCANVASGEVTAFEIQKDGTLLDGKAVAKEPCPGNLSFFELEEP